MPTLTDLLNWFWPPQCVHCRREGAWLCPIATQTIIDQPVLINPLVIPGVDLVLTRGSYDCEPLGQLIKQLKYHYWTGLTNVLHDVLRPTVEQLLDHPGHIVPVPLHRRRRRERGFNQAQLIAKALGQLTNQPIQNILQRSRYTTPQAALSALERTTNILHAFGGAQVAKWPNSAILVDDVITTGSTIAECASVLRHHGTTTIIAVALAKG